MLSKRRAGIAVLYACAIVLLGSAVAISVGDDSRWREGLLPLKAQSLTERGMRGSFVAGWNEPHQVIVTLSTHSGVAEVDAFVKTAAERVGHYQGRPAFDLTWKAYEKGAVIGSGSGSAGANGVLLYDGSRGFTFGTFPVVAGRTYAVAVEVGPGFAPFLRASPSVEVSVATATASVGLAFAESFRRPMAWVAGILGTLVLGIVVWYHHSQRAAQQRDEADEACDG